MLTNIETLFQRLWNPEFAGMLLEPMMLHGLLVCLIFFAVGHYMGQPKCRGAALIGVAACCLCIMPFSGLRKNTKALEASNGAGSKVLLVEEQTKRVSEVKWAYYALAVVAVLALIGGGKLAQIANLGILAGGVCVVLLSGWLQMKDAEIYHPNTRIKIARPVR